MIAVDTNVLVYARRAELSMHDLAMAALKRLAEGDAPWALPIFCIPEFIRVVTHSKLFAPPTKVAAATQFIEHLLESPTVRLLLPTESFLPLFANIVDEYGASGNLVFDAQIAALCIQSGARTILTEDRDFALFSKLTPVGLNAFAAAPL